MLYSIMLVQIRISYCISTTASAMTLLINPRADITSFGQSSTGPKKKLKNDTSITSMTMIVAKIKADGTVFSTDYPSHSQKSNTPFSELCTSGATRLRAVMMIVPFM